MDDNLKNNNDNDLSELWNVELDIMHKFNEVCKKYNLRWFAIAGTLLGAIRHNGFIPWDDDMDVAMFQVDYEKLCSVASSEFKYPYEAQVYRKGNHLTPWHLKIRRSDTTGCTQWEQEYMPDEYNKGIFFDVFPMYSIPDDEQQAQELYKKVSRLNYIIHVCQMTYSDKYLASFSIKKLLRKLYYRTLLLLYGGYDNACKKYLDLCSSYNNQQNQRIGFLSSLPGNKRFIWNRSVFQNSVEWMFEGQTIPIPSDYDNCLRISYGDYMLPKRNGQVHSKLTFDTEISYKNYFDNH